ncbi:MULTISPECIES: TfuA-like protein [unclassified Inquilinus]|uniref:TfuA-like protein n=1 Tax=unclassified Inquilinus TaxID=2645927 RepID=UPI003F8DE711
MKPRLIFTGPTISHAEGSSVLDAIFLPPAVQGSIVLAVHRFDPAAILIIDGGFQSEPAVRHKEILWALSLGIPVVGAASMGALRAAELFPYMQGSGLIYRWYRRYPLAPDDAVAVLHGPEVVNFAPLTSSLIDLRMTIRAAHRRGLIPVDLAASMELIARNLNFRDRTLTRVIEGALKSEDEPTAAAFQARIQSIFVEQKRTDALGALQLLRAGVVAPPAVPDFTLTAAFDRDLEDAGLTLGHGQTRSAAALDTPTSNGEIYVA